MAATACPVSFAATTSNEVTAREKANAALAAAYTIVESQKNKYAELAKDLSDSDSTEVVNRIAEKDIQGTKMSDLFIIFFVL